MPYRPSLLILLLLLLSCAPTQSGDAAREEGEELGSQTELDDEAWRSELLGHRADKDEELGSSKTSPMAGVQYLKSEPGVEIFLAREDDHFGLHESSSTDAAIRFELRENRWYWQELQHGEVTCRVDDVLVPSESSLDGRALFGLDRFQLSFYPSEDRVTLIVFDPERPEKRDFEHLLYFPADRLFAVTAELRPFQEPEQVVMLTSRDLEKTFYRYAKLHFEIDGVEQELSAFKSTLEGEGSDQLFIPFRDSTSARETYGAGRFLEIEEPAEERFVLDFNFAFNPLCNYSPAYNCAIPPRENHLQVAIRAGEMTYPH